MVWRTSQGTSGSRHTLSCSCWSISLIMALRKCAEGKLLSCSRPGRDYFESFSSHLFSFYYSACPGAYISSRMALFGCWRRVCCHFKRPCRKASIFTWKIHPFAILVTETACLCSSAFIASCKLLPILHALSWSLSEDWYEAAADRWVCQRRESSKRSVSKTREWTQLLHYFSKSDNKSNHYHLYPLRLQHHWASIAHGWGSACQR